MMSNLEQKQRIQQFISFIITNTYQTHIGKLIKLCYFIDIYSMAQTNKTITNWNYYSTGYIPNPSPVVMSNLMLHADSLYNLKKYLFIDKDLWYHAKNYDHDITKKVLTQIEIDNTEKVLSKYRNTIPDMKDEFLWHKGTPWQHRDKSMNNILNLRYGLN